MALFTRRPSSGESIQFYSVGQNKTVLLVGLGNPGKEYKNTRHNVGFECLDALVSSTDELSDWINKKDIKCHFSSGQLGQSRVIAIKPTTFMNNSGEAVQAAMAFYKVHPDNVVIVHDEIDIKFGQIRSRGGGSSAGHNGIKSITEHVGESTNRIRIGIGPKKPAQIDSADFVLQKFSAKELEQMPNLTRESNAVLSEYVYGGQLPAETRSFIV